MQQLEWMRIVHLLRSTMPIKWKRSTTYDWTPMCWWRHLQNLDRLRHKKIDPDVEIISWFEVLFAQACMVRPRALHITLMTTLTRSASCLFKSEYVEFKVLKSVVTIRLIEVLAYLKNTTVCISNIVAHEKTQRFPWISRIPVHRRRCWSTWCVRSELITYMRLLYI